MKARHLNKWKQENHEENEGPSFEDMNWVSFERNRQLKLEMYCFGKNTFVSLESCYNEYERIEYQYQNFSMDPWLSWPSTNIQMDVDCILRSIALAARNLMTILSVYGKNDCWRAVFCWIFLSGILSSSAVMIELSKTGIGRHA